MSWTIENADRAGAWSFGVQRDWPQETWDGQLQPKLVEWERLTWAEIDALTTGTKDRHKMHHSMDVEAICDEAQLRLMELNNSDESIFRFRMGGKPRLWGFRRVAVFHVLWFDPTHQIYPVDP